MMQIRTERPPLKLKATNEKIVIDCLLITLAIFIPYHQVAQHSFTDSDDPGYIFQNIHINLGLTWDTTVWAFTTTEMGNWHPLTWISLLIDRELFGVHPGGYLLMNVAWHTLAACLCLLTFLRCTQNRIFALTVALIFALHPVNVENVAWASERKSLLNAVFWFASIISYLDFLRTRSVKAYGLTVIFFILSLFSKAMSVTLPCTLGLIHCLYLVYHPNDHSLPDSLKQDWKQIIRPILPLFALSLYFSVVTLSAQSVAIYSHIPFSVRLINAVTSYVRYLVMFFNPTELAPFYPLHYDGHVDFTSIFIPLAILIVITITTLLLVRKKPQLALGWVWFLGSFVPAIGLIQAGGQSHADRYLYIPMLGLAFIFPALFELLSFMKSWIRNTIVGLTLSVLSVSMISATQIQVSYWRDGITLGRHTLTVAPHGSNAVMALIFSYMRTERFDELISLVDAEINFEKNPLHKGMMTTIQALDLYGRGKYQAAIAHAQTAIDLGHKNQTCYALIALSNYELGQTDQAVQFLTLAKLAPKKLNPNSVNHPFKTQLIALETKLTALSK